MAHTAALLVCFVVLFSVAASAPCYVIAGLSRSLGGDESPVGDGYGTEEFRNALSNAANFGPDGTSQAVFEFRSLDEITPASLEDVDLLILNQWSYCNEGIISVFREENPRPDPGIYPCDPTFLDTILDAVSDGMDLWFIPYGSFDVNADYIGIPQASGFGLENYQTSGANFFQNGPFGDIQTLDSIFSTEWNVNSLTGLSGVQPLYTRSQDDGDGGIIDVPVDVRRSINTFTSQFIFPSGNGRILVDGASGFLFFGPIDVNREAPESAEKKRSFQESSYPPSVVASNSAKLTLNTIDFFVRDSCPSAEIMVTFSDDSACPSKVAKIDASADCAGEWSSSSAITFADATSSATTITISESGIYQLTWTSCNGFPVYKQVSFLEPIVSLPRVLCETALSTGTKFSVAQILQVNCGEKISSIVVSGLPPSTTAEFVVPTRAERAIPPLFPAEIDDSTPGTFIISGTINQLVLDSLIFTLDGTIKGSSLPSKKIFYAIDVFGTDLSLLKSFPRLSLTLCAEGDLARTLAWGCFCSHY